MTKAYYLCNNPDGGGLVFPIELEERVYSQGHFVVDRGAHQARLHSRISIKAVHHDEEIEQIATLLRANIYEASFMEYTFYFAAQKAQYVYIGKSTLFTRNANLYTLEPINNGTFEYSCMKDDFYFVGSLDEGLEPEQKGQNRI